MIERDEKGNITNMWNNCRDICNMFHVKHTSYISKYIDRKWKKINNIPYYFSLSPDLNIAYKNNSRKKYVIIKDGVVLFEGTNCECRLHLSLNTANNMISRLVKNKYFHNHPVYGKLKFEYA